MQLPYYRFPDMIGFVSLFVLLFSGNRGTKRIRFRESTELGRRNVTFMSMSDKLSVMRTCYFGTHRIILPNI